MSESLDPEVHAPTPAPTAGSPSRGVQTAPVVAIGAALVVFVVVSYAFSKNYEILAEGRLLSYTEGEVVQVRFFDAFTLYVARESRVLSDVVTTIALAMLAGIALLAVALVNRKPATDASVKAFFLVCLLGAPYLAADESMAIHETIGHNMQFLATSRASIGRMT